MNFEDSSFDRYEWENLIDRWIFDKKDRIILKRRFLDNMTIERIAEEKEVDLSVSQTSRRFRKAKRKLFEKI